MIKKKRLFLFILIAVYTFICNANTTTAQLVSGGGSTTSGGPSSGGDVSGGTGGISSPNCPNNITAFCKINTGDYVYSEVQFHAYNIYGQRINGEHQQEKIYQETLAGTYIGINVYETKSYNSWANYSVSAIQTYYECKHENWQLVYYCSRYHPVTGVCIGNSGYHNQYLGTTTYEAIFGCNAGDASFKKTRPANPCGSAVASCAARAVPPVIELTPSYKAVYQDSNDIDARVKTDEYNTSETINGGVCNSPQNSSSNKNQYSGSNTYSQTCNFYYNRQKTCINVKTGKVRYINNNEECYPVSDEKKPEYEIKSENGYWKYFVPLNANSGEGFTFSLESSGNIQPPVVCKDIINNYNNYADLIAGPNHEVLPKTTSNMTSTEIAARKAEAKKMVKNGCLYETRITIPIKQKFYNELENGINFKGFNFYYRPIDINEPFPNGINETSLWYEWNNNSKKEPDISKSYNEITYVSKITDVNKIRNYTKDNPYTIWQNMYVNGTSSYIENNDMIKRYVARNSYYPLGCGPINEDEYTDSTKKVKNVFYQKECSK